MDSTLKAIVEEFPGFLNDEEVNGADLVEFIGLLLEAAETAEADRTACPSCHGNDCVCD